MKTFSGLQNNAATLLEFETDSYGINGRDDKEAVVNLLRSVRLKEGQVQCGQEKGRPHAGQSLPGMKAGRQ